MNPCIFIIFSLLLLNLESTSANRLVALEGEGGGDGVISKCLDKERDALLHFKARLQDPDEINCLSTWRADKHDCCKWRGVTCNHTGYVTDLDLSYCHLVGEISHSLVHLRYLNRLVLFQNSFHGTIPTFIGSLTELRYLYLGYNGFNGTIPSSIGSLTKLRELGLHSNNLNGIIPNSIGSLTELRYLVLSGNSLNGTIPPELGNLTNLQDLYLGFNGRCRVENLKWLFHLSHLEHLGMDGISLAKQNHWVDAILSLRKLSYLSLRGCELSQVMSPYSSFINSSSSIIDTLYLGNNNLTSSMYRWLFPLTSNNLISLGLSSNMLDGIPKYLGNLCNLKFLYLYNNSAVVNFPDFLNNLTGCTSLALQQLDASHSQFTGPLSGNIQTLTNLTILDISNNRISDTIPLDFWNSWPCQLRYMNLSSNNISGEVPDLSSNFDNSSVINLSFNSFYGPITNVSSTVASLNLSRNNFSGGISFLCQIAHGILEILDLSHNLLSGKLPDCLWHFKELKVLDLGHNNLSGRLPPSIGSLIKLEALYLSNNNFSGELPLSLKNCTSLNSLILGSNKFSGNVPVWIGENLSGLYVLTLRSNNFLGTIPLQLCQLADLQFLDLSMNQLHGTIPSCLDNLTRMVQETGFLHTQTVHYYWIYWFQSGGDLYDYLNVEYADHAMIEWQGDEREFSSNLRFVKMIDLSSNNLTGQIPDELVNLYELVALNLSKNALLGEIPQKIGQMQKLIWLGLFRNNLSGRIPSSMSQMSFLNDLDVSFNNLSGRIPTSTQLQSFPASRYDGNAQLCGPPLTKTCNGDEELDELWGSFYIGGGTGFVTGFWIACGGLLLNRRGRHAFFQFYDSFSDWVYVKVVVFIANLQRAEHR